MNRRLCIAILAIVGAHAACAPASTHAHEGEVVKEASVTAAADGSTAATDGFAAARARFTAAAEAARGPVAGELDITPREPGDHYDKTQLAALRTGDLLAFKATGDRQTVLTGFAAPDGTATLTPDLVEALRKGRAIKQDAPDLARLFAAAKLGTGDALPYAEVQKRLKFLFHFAKLDRLCPLAAEGDTVRVRWQLSLTDASPNTPRGPAGPRGNVKTHRPWLTARYDRAAGTVELSSGDEGC